MTAHLRLALIVLGTAVSWAAPAEAGVLGELSADDAQWQEETVSEFPAYPESSNLIDVYTHGQARHRYLLDRRSLVVGKDGVVRFVIAIKPMEGDLQVSYAGLYCSKQVWKTYAIGKAGNAWYRIAKPTWEQIEQKSQDAIRYELYKYSVCSGLAPAGTASQIVHNLQKTPSARVR
jgi:mRNA degradation ribonuclease J1/J2